MIKVQALDPFVIYKVRPPVIMNETPKNRKKGQAFIVLAPSVESELKYLSSTNIYLFRSLSKYFVDKKWTHTFRGFGKLIIQPNGEGQITTLLQRYHTGNLRNVEGVTSYLPTLKTRPLKNFNVLVECNYAIERILNNEKDHRLLKVKVQECLQEVWRVVQSAQAGAAGNYLGDYETNLIIPMDLWNTIADYNIPVNFFKRTSPYFMGHVIQELMNKDYLSTFNRIYLTHGDYMLPIDCKNLPEEDYPKYLQELFTKFLMKAKRTKAEYEAQDEMDKLAEENMNKAEEETKEDLVVDKIIKTTNKDPDDIPPEQKAEIKRVVKKNISHAIPSVKRPVDKTTPEIKPIVTPSTKQTVSAPKPEEPAVVKTAAPVYDTDEDEFKLDVDTSDLPDDADTADVPDIVLKDEEDVDTVVAATQEGKTVSSYQRDKVVKEKYKEVNIGEVPLRTVLEAQKEYKIEKASTNDVVINEDMREMKSANFEKSYNENVAQNDLVNILMHFSHVKPAMYITKDIEIEDVSTPTDRILRYSVIFEDENRKRHHVHFKLPKMIQDRYVFLNDQKMNISHQKFPYPVTKIGPDRCQAVTNYKKIISSRYGGNISPRITKIKKVFCGPDCPKIAKVISGDCTPLNTAYLTTVEYDTLGESMTRLAMAKSINTILTCYFIVDEAKVVINMEEFDKKAFPKEDPFTNMLPFANKKDKANPNKYCFSSRTNKVYDMKGTCYGEISDFIVEMATTFDPKVSDLFKDATSGTKFVYSRSRVMKKDVPTVLVCAAADPGGLQEVLKKAKIEYEFLEKLPAGMNRDEKGFVQFEDGYLIYDRYPFENSLLLNGLNTFPTRNYSFYDMGTYDAYVQIFDTMFNSRNLIDALRNFYYCFIDPITMEVLIKLKMPTDFTRLMLYCNDVLADNSYQIESDYHNSRIRSNEIIYAQLYCELAEAWGRYRIGKADNFSIDEDAVIKYILTSNIIDPHSELNMVLETENDRLIKLKGPSGMNEDHSFTIEKRAYHESMYGLIGVNSAPSGEVGIGRHLTMNSNINDARGFITTDKKEYSASELLTPGELMQAFAVESADMERLFMCISQSKHEVPVDDPCSCPVSYDMERVIPYLSNDFARTAKADGTVLAIENGIMIIKYDDGTVDDVNLNDHPAKNTDGGFYIMNQMRVADNVAVGSKVTKGQLVAYDPKYLNNNDMFGQPTANFGTMARIAVETNGGVYEDSCYISNAFAHRMKTKITRQKRVILSKYANITHMASPGHINANENLIVFDDTADEFTSQMLAAMAEELDDDDEVTAGSAPVISKYSGTIRDIQIYYTADPEEMSPSLRDLVDNYSKKAKKVEKTISKYMNLYDANTNSKTSQRLVPDSQGKVKGIKLPDGVIIDFYIEYEDVMAPGDKISCLNIVEG